MPTKLTITFTDGSLIGETRELDLGQDAPIVLGRTRKADIRLSEINVSRRHLELKAGEDGVYALCLSAQGYLLNDKTVVREGESHMLVPGDVVLFGMHERFRVDRVEGFGAPADDITAATRALGQDATAATRPVPLGETMATVPPPEGWAMPAKPADDAPTADDSNPAPSSHYNGIPDPGAKTGTYGGVPPTIGPYSANWPNSASTNGDATSTNGNTIDETIFFGSNRDDRPTPIIDPIIWRKLQELLRQRELFRQRMIALAVIVVVALLGIVVFACWPKAERWISNPVVIVDGKEYADKTRFHFYSDDGLIQLHVDCANGPNLKKNEETSNTVSVTTYVGRDRSVPFNMSFVRRRDPEQLYLSLAECVENEIRELERMGYAFVRSDNDAFDDIGPGKGLAFYELAYPDKCQVKVGQGTLFARREYQRADAKRRWRGILTVLRDGDMVCRLLREIPDDKWANGKYLLWMDCNMALYEGFLENRWESPGREGLVSEREMSPANREALFSKANGLIGRGMPEDLPEMKRMVDSLMALTYNGPTSERKRSVELLRRFRALKDNLYNGFCIERNLALKNDSKSSGPNASLMDIYVKCRGVFQNLKDDVRSQRVRNPEEWPCQ